jgi:hypothetical protein
LLVSDGTSPEPFYASALKEYLSSFDFTGDPIDIALRKLLMELYLPKETQQIDRVMEAFAQHYHECNCELFPSSGVCFPVFFSKKTRCILNERCYPDQPYILAFSLIMLHTDAFNKSNKNKMTKADYIRNTRIDGVPSEVLDCLFDNIVFSPFIFVEDDAESSSGGPLSTPPSSTAEASAGSNGSASAFFGLASSTREKGKVDPYFLIAKGLTHELKAEIELHVPWTSKFLPFFGVSN